MPAKETMHILERQRGRGRGRDGKEDTERCRHFQQDEVRTRSAVDVDRGAMPHLEDDGQKLITRSDLGLDSLRLARIREKLGVITFPFLPRVLSLLSYRTQAGSRLGPRKFATMGRMHSRGKGMSSSALPYKRNPPSWLKITSQEVDDHICKLAKKGLTPSQIGVILRDSHGISQVKSVSGSKILRILKGHGLGPEIPEDLYHLIKKAVAVRKHLERNRKDKDSKFRLILIESRVHRLARYYKRTKKLAPNWKYESPTASTLVA
ncbi:hypothetical protein AXG93_3658s1080 [Marchantia polymorpha subsp. ruderalis]|uniref:Small ribosomal subunit protein uS15 N-terminal domain-containing protein n=3 Tax=Marchantia polymorpha TaxID=3197 RepID=A0A176VNJ7_MARPO|nr:hypothetical protein AXG93_3658s1080 [Marchantia polymorpha subsp. ruderalis]